ncbi:MAG: CcmD family protein [bacterium]
MRHVFTPLNTILVIITILCTNTFAQGTRLIHYQGVLKNSDGIPFSGTTNLQFNLYKTPVSEQPIWTEVHKNIEVSDGSYEVLLGSQKPLRLSFYNYYLEVKTPDFETPTHRIAIAGPGYNWRLSFLFAAYTIIWVAIFVYLLSISRRQKKIINELEMLAKVKSVRNP